VIGEEQWKGKGLVRATKEKKEENRRKKEKEKKEEEACGLWIQREKGGKEERKENEVDRVRTRGAMLVARKRYSNLLITIQVMTHGRGRLPLFFKPLVYINYSRTLFY
jgi:uncharacterized membrane protein YdbT with pleckstrin-like domain